MSEMHGIICGGDNTASIAMFTAARYQAKCGDQQDNPIAEYTEQAADDTAVKAGAES